MVPLLALLLSLSPASAAELSVVGSLVREHSLQPGERTTGVVYVRNNDDVPREVIVHQADYRFHADGRNDFVEPGTLQRSNAGWIEYSPEHSLVLPGDTVPVYYALDVPADCDQAGSTWSLLMIEALPEAVTRDEALPERGVQVQTVVRYGVLLVSELGGEAAAELAFQEARLETGPRGPSLSLDIENTGQLKLQPQVWIDLFDGSGQALGRVPADKQSLLLPGSSARFTIDLSGYPAGSYSGLVLADAGGDMVFGTDYHLDLRP